MAQLNQDALGPEGKILLSEIKDWDNRSKHYPENGMQHERANIFKKLNALAISAQNDFKALLGADDLLDSSKDNREARSKFFFDYMNANPQSEALYINISDSMGLISYVQTMCDGMENLFGLSNYSQNLATIKIKISSFSSIIQKIASNHREADAAKFAIIKFLISYVYNNKTLSTQDYVYFANQIKEQVQTLQDVNNLERLLDNIVWLKNRDQDLATDLAYILINKGLNITATENSKGLNFPSFDIQENNLEANYKLFKYALSLHPKISIADLNDGIKKTFAHRNLGAMKAYFEAMSKQGQQPDKFQFVGMFQESHCLRDWDIGRLVYYLNLCESSICEVLEHLSSTPEILFKAIKSICYVSTYCMYEKGPVKGVFYHLATNLDLSAKLTNDSHEFIPFYINARYKLDIRNNYGGEDEKYIAGGHLVSELFVKSDPKLCPVTIAVANNNVQFILFVLKVIAAPVATNADFKNKISAAVLKLMDQDQDISCIREFLTERCDAAWRPWSWFSFEYGLRSEIDKKTLALTKPTQNTPMFKAHVAKQKQSEMHEPAKSSGIELQLS